MADTKTRIEVYEVRTTDGVGIQIGDGPVHMGVSEADLFRFLQAAMPEGDGPVDTELVDLAHTYFDYWEAQRRYKYLQDMERWG